MNRGKCEFPPPYRIISWIDYSRGSCEDILEVICPLPVFKLRKIPFEVSSNNPRSERPCQALQTSQNQRKCSPTAFYSRTSTPIPLNHYTIFPRSHIDC
ncbi:hypothetical protein J6590_017864 [Homalodisca vitripennis]|nr:hypothetical protein J6590_017864 [Homalodisca vitripennis]